MSGHKWEMRTNRHTTTGGYSWGWIEGHPKGLCWSNDPCASAPSGEAAARLVHDHNASIDEEPTNEQ